MSARFQYVGGLLLAGAVLSGCKQAAVEPDLRSNASMSRIPALVHSADQPDEQSLHELIYALSDNDPAVRLFAIQSLHKRTGQTRGYRYYDPPERRAQAVQSWRDWLQAHSAAPAPEPVSADPPRAVAP